jgi:multidrug resistance efflux pump
VNFEAPPGVIGASNAVAGQIADPNTVLFQVVDPAHLWVEALSFEAMPAGLNAFA